MIAAAEVCNQSDTKMGNHCRVVNGNPHLGATVIGALFGLTAERILKKYEDHKAAVPVVTMTP